MVQLTQANQVIANSQQQNHQVMVTVQEQQAEAFGVIAAATEQKKYDALFAAIPKVDGKKQVGMCPLDQQDLLTHHLNRKEPANGVTE